MTLNAPLWRRSSRQAGHRKGHARMNRPIHTHLLSTRLGATLHHRNSWGISALPRRQMKLVGIVVTEWPLWESYNVVLHPLCTAWGGKSCLEGWFAGLQGCCYPPPPPPLPQTRWDAGQGGMINWLQGQGCLLWPCLTREVALWSPDTHDSFNTWTNGRPDVARFGFEQKWLTNKLGLINVIMHVLSHAF